MGLGPAPTGPLLGIYGVFARPLAPPEFGMAANGITLNNGLQFKRFEDYAEGERWRICCIIGCAKGLFKRDILWYSGQFATTESLYCEEHDRYTQKLADKDPSSALSTDGNPTTIPMTGML